MSGERVGRLAEPQGIRAGQSVTAQVAQLRAADCGQVFRGVASGATSDRRASWRKPIKLAARDMLMSTRLDRPIRATPGCNH